RPRTALLAAEDGISVRAIADRYRADLFAAGLGHGHHGFRARVPLGAGRRLRLVDEASGLSLSEILFPAADASDDRPLTVEALIAGPPRWT
ncbi:hypothetical protein, partial [Klebsiella pneumoniae]|uniref:hypothetical protein n=1 Tax=Klebsiella pneumoniae TaxID=573 RepID=UPI00195403F8